MTSLQCDNDIETISALLCYVHGIHVAFGDGLPSQRDTCSTEPWCIWVISLGKLSNKHLSAGDSRHHNAPVTSSWCCRAKEAHCHQQLICWLGITSMWPESCHATSKSRCSFETTYVRNRSTTHTHTQTHTWAFSDPDPLCKKILYWMIKAWNVCGARPSATIANKTWPILTYPERDKALNSWITDHHAVMIRVISNR